jgi:hypothetical protein
MTVARSLLKKISRRYVLQVTISSDSGSAALRLRRLLALILIAMGIRASFRGSTPISLHLHGANVLERERAREDGMRDVGAGRVLFPRLDWDFGI